MKKRNYVISFQKKDAAFNAKDFEQMWMNARTMKDAIKQAREYAKNNNRRFVAVYYVKPITHEI